MLKEKIKKLQQEKDVVILAHYYVDGAVQVLGLHQRRACHVKEEIYSS